MRLPSLDTALLHLSFGDLLLPTRVQSGRSSFVLCTLAARQADATRHLLWVCSGTKGGKGDGRPDITTRLVHTSFLYLAENSRTLVVGFDVPKHRSFGTTYRLFWSPTVQCYNVFLGSIIGRSGPFGRPPCYPGIGKHFVSVLPGIRLRPFSF